MSGAQWSPAHLLRMAALLESDYPSVSQDVADALRAFADHIEALRRARDGHLRSEPLYLFAKEALDALDAGRGDG